MLWIIFALIICFFGVKFARNDNSFRAAMQKAMISNSNDRFESIVSMRSKLKGVRFVHSNDVLIDAWAKFIMALPYDTIMDNGLCLRLIEPMEVLSIPIDKWAATKVPVKILELAAYTDIFSGANQYPAAQGVDVSVILNKKESLVIRIKNVKLMKNVSNRQYSRTSSGSSIRIAKGFNVRSGRSRATSVKIYSKQIVDQGTLVISTQAVIFCGDSNTMRIIYSKIIDIDNYKDGIRISQDGKEPLIFIMDNPTFANGLTSMLMQRAA